MSWAERRAALLAGTAPVKEPESPAVERVPFEPSLPHFTINGHGGWVLTPYAWAHCIVCGVELPEDRTGECIDCRAKIDAAVMPWD